MSDDSVLRRKAREVMDSGRLPDRAPDHVWGGPGTGATCAVCGETIGHGETELEIEFAQANRSDAHIHLVHLRCFSILEGERRARATGASGRAKPVLGANGSRGKTHVA